jgi:hypothetical protein
MDFHLQQVQDLTLIVGIVVPPRVQQPNQRLRLALLNIVPRVSCDIWIYH